MPVSVSFTTFDEEAEQPEAVVAEKTWRSCPGDVGEIQYIGRVLLRQSVKRVRAEELNQPPTLLSVRVVPVDATGRQLRRVRKSAPTGVRSEPDSTCWSP